MSRNVAPHLLTRASRPAPEAGLRFLGDLALAPARVHEICGAARRTLALQIARAHNGHIFWIRPRWASDRLHSPAASR